MFKLLSYRMMIVVAALMLAMTSIGSAARLAPADMERADVAAFLAIGGTLEDLCQDGPSHSHAEHCPFCNTVAQASVVAPEGEIWTLTPNPLQLTYVAFAMDGQRHDNQSYARGPPTTA